jgi:hypothetical protein
MDVIMERLAYFDHHEDYRVFTLNGEEDERLA